MAEKMRENRAGNVTGIERLVKCIRSGNAGKRKPETEQAARLCILDALGCGIYGSRTEEGELFIKGVSRMNQGEIPVWGTGTGFTADMAAMINGALCHVRELDDVHYAILHTGAVCVPAAVAAAQQNGGNLGKLIEAVIAGVDVTVRISESMDFLNHRERGWHGTATCGAFGAAAAAGVLLNLSEEQMVHALGIAGSRTGGSWAFAADGTMTKRLHPGMAARDGIISAYLAKEGATGPHYILEADDGGFYRLMSREYHLDFLDRKRKKEAVEEVEFKWFASCKSVHSPYTAAKVICDRNPGKSPSAIRRVIAEVNQSAIEMAAGMYRPDSVVSAQISIPYGVALGLMGYSGQAEDYTPVRMQNPEILRLAGIVQVKESEEMNRLRREEMRSAAVVTVEWEDGSVDSEHVKAPKGSMFLPLTEDDITGKFRNLTEPVIGPVRAQQIQRFVLNEERSADIGVLTHLLRD